MESNKKDIIGCSTDYLKCKKQIPKEKQIFEIYNLNDEMKEGIKQFEEKDLIKKIIKNITLFEIQDKKKHIEYTSLTNDEIEIIICKFIKLKVNTSKNEPLKYDIIYNNMPLWGTKTKIKQLIPHLKTKQDIGLIYIWLESIFNLDDDHTQI